MFGIGLVELFIVLVVALIVVGPDKVPEVATWLGKTVRNISQFVQEIKSGASFNGISNNNNANNNARNNGENSGGKIAQTTEVNNPNIFPNPENLELNNEVVSEVKNEPKIGAKNEPK